MNGLVDNAWIIAALPIIMSAALAVAGRRLREPIGGWIATGTAALSFLLTFVCFVAILTAPEDAKVVTRTIYEWMPAGGFRIPLSFRIDPLSLSFMLLITGVGSLIHLYAIGYMHGDERFTTFFSYLNLFVGSMLILVMGDNYLVMFVGWELVGACSYLLIGFWFTDLRNSTAAKKAFVTNRVGDFGFIVAMMLIFATVGSLDYGAVFAAAPAAFTAGGVTITLVCLLLLVGATGKSAQIPLFVWLPDAMAGPTPVSALIHAATMVTAGVYLIARSFVLFDLAPLAQGIVATVGIGTALFAALIALGQYKLKKVLAYSTVSQIGFMIAGVGIGGAGFVAGISHVISHGFFKALLFLGAGSVMHAMDGEEDMRRLGGLRRSMPVTSATFLVGVLAISGIPPFSGFWTKDAVQASLFESGTWYGPLLWAVGGATALLTAIYMFRVWFKTFTGDKLWAEDAHPHESPWTMALPLVVLAFFAAVIGFIEVPGASALHAWLKPVFGEASPAVELNALTVALLVGSAIVAFIGAGIGWFLWSKTDADARRDLEMRPGLPPLVNAVRNKFWVDEALQKGIEKPGWELTGVAEKIDQSGIDAVAMKGVGGGLERLGARFSRFENGNVRTYAGVILGGVVLLIGYVVVRGGLG